MDVTEQVAETAKSDRYSCKTRQMMKMNLQTYRAIGRSENPGEGGGHNLPPPG